MKGYFIVILIFAWQLAIGQDSPCHCLTFSIDFHRESGKSYSFEFDKETVDKNGEKTYVFKSDGREELVAIGRLSLPSKDAFPQVEYHSLSKMHHIGLVLDWDYKMDKANQLHLEYIEKYKDYTKSAFDFLEPINAVVKLNFLVFPAFIPMEKLDSGDVMEVNITINAHEFYSDWNPNSPFHTKNPSFKVALGYFAGTKWAVTLKDGLVLEKRLISSKK